MADATGTPTNNYFFKTISGTDVAGYTSINSVITSIDTNLQNKAIKTNSMILVDVPTGETAATYMSGYSISSGALTSGEYGAVGLNAPIGAYYWYKKS
jgi:hypothetical protein